MKKEKLNYRPASRLGSSWSLGAMTGDKMFLTTLAVVLMAMLIVAFVPQARSQESFNITNSLQSGLLIQSYPTNVPSSNFIITGTVTNGGVITTNGFYPGQQTGGAINVQNYQHIGFTWQGIIITGNQPGTTYITFVRSPKSTPAFQNTNIWTTIFPTLPTGFNPWETSTFLTVQFTYAATPQTNFITVVTNLPDYFSGQACKNVGIYSLTNFGTSGSYWTNPFAGLIRNYQEFGLVGGN